MVYTLREEEPWDSTPSFFFQSGHRSSFLASTPCSSETRLKDYKLESEVREETLFRRCFTGLDEVEMVSSSSGRDFVHAV